MLLNNERHARYHATGPKDCYFGPKEEAVMMFSVTRSTIDNEQMSVSIPVFSSDSREALDLRLGMALSIIQDRMEDANKAWQEVQAAEEEKE